MGKDLSDHFNREYGSWLADIKARIGKVQVKAALAVNATMIDFYFEFGEMITAKQTAWGTKFIEQLAKDLKEGFPDMQGFSTRNLKYIRHFYQFYQSQIGQQVVAQFDFDLLKQIPWDHNILIFTKSKDIEEAYFYVTQTIENNWSRDMLALQIKSNLYNRKGKAVTNFSHTLPTPMSDLARQTLKDPYIFDFVSMTSTMKEKDLEKQLVSHISKFY